MPETKLYFYVDDDGDAPLLDWLDDLTETDRRAYLKCRELIGRLAAKGYELRRPTADLLEDGIYELRAKVGRVNYRILYFFGDRNVAVLLHGLTKKRAIARSDLTRARERKARFEADPQRHTYRET